MFGCNRIRIKDIIFVNQLVGNAKGSHTKFITDGISHYQLLYKLSGEAIITFNGKSVKETADNLRFTPNPEDFDRLPLYTADVIKQGESINIGFTSDSPLPKEIIVKRIAHSTKLKQLFQKIQKLWYNKHEGHYYRCIAVLYDILAETSVIESNYLSQNLYKQISPAVEYIDNHFTEQDINCDQLAMLCGISHTYMTKLFNRRFGLSPKRYILEAFVFSTRASVSALDSCFCAFDLKDGPLL